MEIYLFYFASLGDTVIELLLVTAHLYGLLRIAKPQCPLPTGSATPEIFLDSSLRR